MVGHRSNNPKNGSTRSSLAKARLWLVTDDNDESLLVRAQDGGRVASFPELQSSGTLVDALSAIIYAASALHAAGNFPQADLVPDDEWQKIIETMQQRAAQQEMMENMPKLAKAAKDLQHKTEEGSPMKLLESAA